MRSPPLRRKTSAKSLTLRQSGKSSLMSWPDAKLTPQPNKQADQAAKMGLQKNIQPCPIPHTDLRPLVKEYIGQTWQAEWNEYPANKLHSIFPSVKDAKPEYLTNRNDQTVFTRCCIGHSRLTNDYHLKGEPPPECMPLYSNYQTPIIKLCRF